MTADIKTEGAAATVLLQQAETVSLLRSGVCQRLAGLLPGWARDPELYGAVFAFGTGASPVESSAEASFEDKRSGAELAWRLECFSKPTVSLIDQPISGYAAGLVLAGTHRVAGDGYRFSVAPRDLLVAADGGLAHRLSHMAPGVGAYLVATRRTIGPDAALRAGLVTHTIAQEHFGEIAGGVAEAEPVDPLLDDRQMAANLGGDDRQLAELITACFADCRLDVIRSLLAARSGSEPLAATVLAEVEATAGSEPLAEALALLDRATLTDMRTSLIASFAAAGYPEIALPTRAEHQAIRGR